MRRTLIAVAALTAFAASTHAEEATPHNPVMKLTNGHVCQLANGKVVTHGSCKSAKADALVRRSNELVKGDPTCKQLLEASKLLNQATEIYIAVGSVGGEVRDISRAGSWTEDRARDGKCKE